MMSFLFKGFFFSTLAYASSPSEFIFPVFPCLAVTQGPAFDTVFMPRIDTYLVLWATGNPSLQSTSYAGLTHSRI